MVIYPPVGTTAYVRVLPRATTPICHRIDDRLGRAVNRFGRYFAGPREVVQTYDSLATMRTTIDLTFLRKNFKGTHTDGIPLSTHKRVL